MADEFTETVSARIMGEAMLAFITARLDELAETDWHVFDCSGMPEEDGHCCDTGRWLARDIEGKRAILARYEDTMARQEDDDYPAGTAQEQAREYEDFVLPALAAAWSDHPGYDQEWT